MTSKLHQVLIQIENELKGRDIIIFFLTVYLTLLSESDRRRDQGTGRSGCQRVCRLRTSETSSKSIFPVNGTMTDISVLSTTFASFWSTTACTAVRIYIHTSSKTINGGKSLTTR